MEIERDFIKREVQKISMLLTALLEKVYGSNANHLNITIDDLNETFIEMFDLSLTEFIEMEEPELETILEGIDQDHLDKIIDLLFEIVQRKQNDGYKFGIDYNVISNRTIFLIDYLDKTSKTFSFQRMDIKSKLR